MKTNRALTCLAIMAVLAVAAMLFGCLDSGSSSLPAPKYAVTANYTTHTLGVYSVNTSSGALTEIGTSPYASLTGGPGPIALHPNGKWIYVGGSTSTIQAFSIDNTTGHLTSLGTVTNGGGNGLPTGIIVTSDGKFLIAGTSANANLSVFSIDQTTGVPSAVAGSPFNSGASGLGTLVSVGNFLYASDVNSHGVFGFTLATSGTPSAIAGSPWLAGVNIASIAADRSGNYLYSGTVSHSIYGNPINQTTGALGAALAGFPVASHGNDVDQMVFDPRNKFMYVADDSVTISAYLFTSTTGALTEVTGSPFAAAGANTDAVAVDPSGKFVYCTSFGADKISAYTINQTTGALTAVSGSPYTGNGAPNGPHGVVVTH